jgi:hypothetical protein
MGKAVSRDDVASIRRNRFQAEAAPDLWTAALTRSTVAPRSELSAREK